MSDSTPARAAGNTRGTLAVLVCLLGVSLWLGGRHTPSPFAAVGNAPSAPLPLWAAPASASLLLRVGVADRGPSVERMAAQAFRDVLLSLEKGRIYPSVVDATVWGRPQAGDVELVRAVIAGDPPLAVVGSAALANSCPSLDVLEVSYLFQDDEHVDRILRGPTGRGLLDSLEARGLQGLAFVGEAFRVLAASRPLPRPTDLAGYRVGTVENAVGGLFVSALGAEAVPAPRGRLREMVRSGFVDAADTDLTLLQNVRLGTILPYVLETHHAVSARVLIANSRFMRELPTPHRISVWRAVLGATAAARREVLRASEKARRMALAQNRLRTLTPHETQSLRTSVNRAMSLALSSMDPRIVHEITLARPLSRAIKR